MQHNIFQIFVYGSLRSGFQAPAYHYISKYFTLVSHAKAKGLLFDLGDFPVAISTTEDKYLVGELYEINDKSVFDFAIAQLDDYEGLNAEEGDITQYERAITEVVYNSKTTKAWVYWYKGSTEKMPVIESGDVLEYFKQKNNL